MRSLVIGATGATGKLVVDQLLSQGAEVKAVVRAKTGLLEPNLDDPNLSIIEASISEVSVDELAEHLIDCDAAISCLGHHLSFKGIFGPPRQLVTDTIQKVAAAAMTLPRNSPFKLVLMGSAGVSNRDLVEPVSTAQRCVIGLLKALLPPHADNETAADYLRTEIGRGHEQVSWVVVRPDDLINEGGVSPYELHPSPIRSAIFNSGQTSRINVANFMADLVLNDDRWREWQGRMPVIYNRESSSD